MTTFHFVSGFHGHVGKSTFLTVLEHTLSSLGLSVLVVDADYQKQTTTKLYGGEDCVPQIIFSRDPDYSDSPDEIIELAYEHPDAHIVVDLAADTDRYLNNWLRERGLLDAAKDVGIALYKWWVSDRDYESLSALAQCAESEEMADVHHILVKSHYSGRAELWPATLQTHEELAAVIGSGRVKHIDFHRGFGELVAQAQRDCLTWNAVMADTDFKKVKRLNYASYKRWLEKNKVAISTVYNPGPLEQASTKSKKSVAKKTVSRKKTSKTTSESQERTETTLAKVE